MVNLKVHHSTMAIAYFQYEPIMELTTFFNIFVAAGEDEDSLFKTFPKTLYTLVNNSVIL